MALKLVLVEWIDPWSKGGWTDKEDLDKEFNHPLDCQTVGWILKENKDKLMIACSLQVEGKGDQVGDLFIIPKSCVKRVIPLTPCPTEHKKK